MQPELLQKPEHVVPVPLRAAFFSDAAPDRNGVGTYYRDLSVHLEQRLAAVQLFCPERDANGWRDPIRLPLPGDATQKICIPNPRMLAKRYRSLAPDTVVLATPGPYGMLGLRLARQSGARIIVGFHTHFEKLADLYWKHQRVRGRIFRFYLESCNRLLFRYGSTVMANSAEMLEVAHRIGAKNIELMGTTIPRHFIDTPVSPLGDKLESVTFAGRFAAEKNLESIIAAAGELPHIEFRFAGDGPQRALVDEAANHFANIRYLGWLPRELMLEAIDATDMLVLPSHVESFGTIALEAMTRNRCVLVSQHCGINQWPSLAGGLFSIGSDESVSAAVARIALLDADERRKKAHTARQVAIALNEWTLDHWVDVLGRAGDKEGSK